jgi:pyochelin synthetase
VAATREGPPVTTITGQTRDVGDGDFAPFPLTDMQQAWWVGRDSALELGNVPPQRWIEIEGEIAIDRFTAALHRLIDRHGMLRAVVRRDGEQQILPTVPPYRVEVLDLLGQASEVVRGRLAGVRHDMSEERFATDRWPLFSVRATRLGERRYRLHFNFDMLLVDLVSFQIMFRDLAMLYEDRDSELPPLEVSFRDCVLATRSFEESDSYKRSRDYWWSRLPTLPPTPELPLDRPVGSIDRPRFRVRTLSLEPEAWTRLKARAAEVGVTPTTVVLTAFAEMLRTWSARPAFSFVMVVFNRPAVHPNVNDLIGDFTSTVLLTVDDRRDESFEVRAKRLQQQVWERLRHRHVSGVQVLRELNRIHGTPVRAGAPVVFNSILQPPRGNLPSASTLEGPLPEVDRAILEDAGGLERLRTERRIGALGELVYSAGQAPQILLEARASERAGRLVIVVDDVDELFPHGLVDDMVGALGRLLQRLSEDRSVWRGPMPSLVPEAHLAQRRAVNAGADVAVPLAPLHTLVAAQVERDPRGPAVAWAGGEMTFGDLHDRAARLAQALRHRQMEPNRPVAVVMERGWEQVVAVLGTLRAGAPYVPIDPDLPRERLWHLLRHSRARIALSQTRVLATLERPEGLDWVAVDGELSAGAGVPIGEQLEGVEHLAYVIYTSGSTGLPKGVMISHRGAANTILDINRRFDVGPGDRVLAVSSLSFDLSVYDIFGVLAAGGTVVVLDPSGVRDPAHWAGLALRQQVTIWNSVPSLLELLVEYLETHPQVSPPPLRLVMLSGDWLPVGLPARIRELFSGVEIVSLGGATEASIWSVYYPIGSVDPSWRRIPYGRPLANQPLHVLDDAFAHRPIWVPGQLYIGGMGVAMGYWQDPDKTAASFITHPRTGERLYRTGDLCRYLPDGNLDILGRQDLQVKVRGFRIELGEIEATLLQHHEVREAVVVAHGTTAATRSLVAYVVTEQERRPSPDDLHAFLRSKLPEYMLPAAYVALPAVPRNPNGKIAYDLLPDPQPAAPRPGPDTLPEEYHSAARTVCALIGSVLSIDDLEPGDVNLIDLGASSIDYIRIMNRLEEELGFRPDLETLFEEPTLANLARSYHAWLRAEAGR